MSAPRSKAREKAPANALRLNRFTPVTDLDAGDRGNLNLHNIIFVDGGSLIWFEEPDVLAVMQARGGGEVTRYRGEWEPASPVAADPTTGTGT